MGVVDVDFEAAEKLLLNADFEDARPLWYSSNYVYLARLCGGDGNVFAAVYKPLRGEAPLWDFPNGTLYKREAAAYRLARLLDWPFVPPTVVRDGPQGVGSLQVYVEHDPQRHFFEQRDDPELIPQLKRMAVFDYVANNADRKGGHCLLTEDGHIWGIDHGLCFHQQYKMRTVIWDWSEERIATDWLDDVRRACALLSRDAPETRAFTELLSAQEVAAVVERMQAIVRSRRFPTPGPHRSYPWPLV